MLSDKVDKEPGMSAEQVLRDSPAGYVWERMRGMCCAEDCGWCMETVGLVDVVCAFATCPLLKEAKP